MPSSRTDNSTTILSYAAGVAGWLAVLERNRAIIAAALGETSDLAIAALGNDAAGSNPLRGGTAEKIQGAFRAGSDLARFAIEADGSDFRKSVWHAIRSIPAGATLSYSALARAAGRPAAIRAAASACAANRLALLIPCHRVIGADGRPGNFRWGREIKQKLLTHEQTIGADLSHR